MVSNSTKIRGEAYENKNPSDLIKENLPTCKTGTNQLKQIKRYKKLKKYLNCSKSNKGRNVRILYF